MKTSAIIVTFNRKEELARCIDAVLRQSHPVSKLYIIDNASTDGTFDYLKEGQFLPDTAEVSDKGYFSFEKEDQRIIYVRLTYNSGGAGGFHDGLKTAYEDGDADYFWMMDDDGYPEQECLEKQLKLVDQHHYVMPISLDIDEPEMLSWFVRDRKGVKTKEYKILKDSWGELMDFVVPFNGTLLTKELVSKVGYVNKDFFIWGDDYDHYWRCRKQGYVPVTAMDALFYHPSDKATHTRMFFGLIPINYTDNKWRFVCLIRNSTYIYWNHTQKISILVKWMMYTWFFMVHRRFDFKGYALYLGSVSDGLRKKFDRHWKYLKNGKK